jgi:polysaccharide pyruvyl transferase WcaK-like protein
MNYNNRVGRSINDDKVYLNYLTAVALFIMGLLERGHSVRILIGDVVWDQGVRHDLRKVLEDYGSRKFEGKIIDESALSVDELLSQLASVDLVVSSRFHNLVLALTLHKPVIAISYHEKFQPLMNAVGLGTFCQDIEQIDVKELIEKVAMALGCTLDSKTHIAQKAEQFRIALDEQYARIINIAHSLNEDSKAHLVTTLLSCLSNR